MPKLAESIVVRRSRGKAQYHIDIDGQEFPWYTTNGMTFNLDKDEIGNISIQIPADSIRIEDDFLVKLSKEESDDKDVNGV